MTTAVEDLMSSPPVTCPADASLTEATSLMDSRQIGSVVVTDGGAVVGILTERDLLRAAATRADRCTEPVRRWMTADPDVLGLDDEVGRGLVGADPPPLPPSPRRRRRPSGGRGVASATSWPWPRSGRPSNGAPTCPADWRGWWWPRPRSATSAARRASSTTASTRPPSWPPTGRSRMSGSCSSTASSPTGPHRPRFAARGGRAARAPRPGWPGCFPPWPRSGAPLDALRTGGLAPRGRARVAAHPRHRPPRAAGPGAPPRAPSSPPCSPPSTASSRARTRYRPGTTSPTPPTTCGCCRGEEAPAAHVRAIEQYLILTIDHGFNASTFAARVIASTGPTWPPPIVGAIGALSGPLHGGAPSRALDMLDAIGTPDRAEAWIRDAVATGRPDHGVRPPGLQDRRPPVGLPPRGGPDSSAATWSTSPSRWSGPRSTSWPSSSPAASSTPTSSSSPGWSCTPAASPARCSPPPSPRAGPSAGPPTSWSRPPTTG